MIKNKERFGMKQLLRNFLLLSIAVGGGGCALFGIETGYRSLTVKNHRFQPAQIEVPKGVPFVLTVDAIDDGDLFIAAPDLGITRLRIPATAKNPRPNSVSMAAVSRNARLPLGPLKEGRYRIFCDCHGNPAVADIVAE